MKLIKSKIRSGLTDFNLNALMVLAKTNLQPDFEKLASNIEQQNRIRVFQVYSKIKKLNSSFMHYNL